LGEGDDRFDLVPAQLAAKCGALGVTHHVRIDTDLAHTATSPSEPITMSLTMPSSVTGFLISGS